MTKPRKTVIIVYHEYYGCDTGCCGHRVERFYEDDVKVEGFSPYYVNPASERDTFDFAHPYGEDHKQWAKDFVKSALGEEHVKDLDWDHCIIEVN